MPNLILIYYRLSDPQKNGVGFWREWKVINTWKLSRLLRPKNFQTKLIFRVSKLKKIFRSFSDTEHPLRFVSLLSPPYMWQHSETLLCLCVCMCVFAPMGKPSKCFLSEASPPPKTNERGFDLGNFDSSSTGNASSMTEKYVASVRR
jgi:hypothetical protein